MQDLETAMMTNKRNQFSQTEGVKVVDAATQTEEEVVEEKLRQVDNKKPNQSVEGAEKTPRQEDDRKLTKTADLRKVDELYQNGDEEETGSRYVILVKEGTEVRKRGEDKEVQGTETEGREEEKEEQASEEQGVEGEDREEEKESGTIYSYAITEGKNMKRGDTKDKHSTLFH